MEKTMDRYWDDVADEVSSALAVTWDECHKIYVLMDDEQLAIMEGLRSVTGSCRGVTLPE